MDLKAKSILKILVIFVLTAIVAYAMVFGLKIGNYKVIPIKDSIKLGLDLQGGVSVLMEAVPKSGEKITNEKMDSAVEVIDRRVNQLGVAEAITVREGDTRIRVELPGVKDSQKALELIGKTASLEFLSPDGDIIITGKNVRDAKAVYQQVKQGGIQEPAVALKLDKEGAKKFEKATEKYIEKPIAIVLDGQVLSAPIVRSVITEGEASISGLEDIEKAGELAALIRAGSLPVDLKQRQVMSVGPTLGVDSLNRSLKAGYIGIAIILIYMAAFYRLPGVVADFALLIYILIVLTVFSAIGATLTLPGIAGFILSIGMAVDANVLIFERLKEELRNGKTIRASVDAGFHALSTIIDSNITTIIAAFVLMYFGSGPIKGFAVTLMIGILSSMFTAIFITKILLVNIVNLRIFTNKKMFGV